jgi:hypothetical protein
MQVFVVHHVSSCDEVALAFADDVLVVFPQLGMVSDILQYSLNVELERKNNKHKCMSEVEKSPNFSKISIM